MSRHTLSAKDGAVQVSCLRCTPRLLGQKIIHELTCRFAPTDEPEHVGTPKHTPIHPQVQPVPMPSWKLALRQRQAEVGFHRGSTAQREAQKALLLHYEAGPWPQFFVTVQFNQPVSVEAARYRIQVLGTHLARTILGRNFWKLPDSERLEWVAFFEGEYNPQLHILVWLPPGLRDILVWRFGAAFRGWVPGKCAPAGTLDIQDLRHNADTFSVLSYVLKYYDPLKPERMIFSDEFKRKGEFTINERGLRATDTKAPRPVSRPTRAV